MLDSPQVQGSEVLMHAGHSGPIESRTPPSGCNPCFVERTYSFLLWDGALTLEFLVSPESSTERTFAVSFSSRPACVAVSRRKNSKRCERKPGPSRSSRRYHIDSRIKSLNLHNFSTSGQRRRRSCRGESRNWRPKSKTGRRATQTQTQKPSNCKMTCKLTLYLLPNSNFSSLLKPIWTNEWRLQRRSRRNRSTKSAL